MIAATAPVTLFLSRLKGVKPAAGGWIALCPAHQDHDQSLKIAVGGDGRVLATCFTGCTFRDVVAATGLSMKDTFGDNPMPYRPEPLRIVKPETNGGDPKHSWPVVATYEYVNADGGLVFQVLRKESGDGRKTFQQRQKGPDGWVYGLAGIEQRPLYRLPELLEDLAADRLIILVEGEKDCDTLRELGFPGCAHMGGSNAWKDEYAQQLAGSAITILPDNDEPGRAWALEAAESLVNHGCSVCMAALPVGEKGDVTDWVKAGGTPEQLTKILARAKAWAVGDAVPLPPGPSRFKLYSASELAELPSLEWLVGEQGAGIFPGAALTGFFGPPGCGKSFLATDLACSVANRASDQWMGNTVRHGSVLYVAAEGGRGFRHRVESWCRRAQVPMEELDLFFILEPVNLYGPDDVGHVLRAADLLREPPALVVFDTVARCMVGGDENSAQDMGLLIERADLVKRSIGATVKLVHHARKDGDVERGSGALRAGVDTLCLVREDEDGSRVISCEKQKDADDFAPMSFWLSPVGESCVVSTQPPAGPRALTANQRAALKTLAETFPKGTTSTAWMKTSGVADRSFYRVCAWLVSQGYVSEYESGRSTVYSVTPSGRWAVNGLVT